MVDVRIKGGYKKTKVGVIPEDWEVIEIGEVGTFAKGRGIKKDEAQSGNIPCVRYGELYTSHNDVIRFYNSFINSKIAETSKKLRKGDLLFAGSGETKEDIGKCAAFLDEFEAYAGGDIIILSPKQGDSVFWGYLFNSPVVSKQKSSKGQGDAVVHINTSNLSRISVPFPLLPEQKAVATALTDTDNLIKTLKKLIDKKKKINQGTMQQLLTGKKRLPGFSGEWDTKSIKNIATISTGSRNTQDRVKDGEYPFYVRSSTVERINTYSFDGEAVLTAGDGVGTGKVFHYVNGKFDIHQRVYKISDFSKKIHGYFFYLYFSNNFYDRIMSMTAKSSVDSVRMEMISDMEIPLPSIEEQRLISEILKDMESEIELLEQKLEKLKMIKQGMMQELLTGRIRLI